MTITGSNDFHVGSAGPANRSTERQAYWTTLDELRTSATFMGCTRKQFDDAVGMCGDDPHTVATYLQREAFDWTVAPPIEASHATTA